MSDYRVCRLIKDDRTLWVVTENELPIFDIFQWLEIHADSSENTSRTYAHGIVQFLRYLDTRGIRYDDVRKNSVIDGFAEYLTANPQSLEDDPVAPRACNSVGTTISIVVSFYRWFAGVNGMFLTDEPHGMTQPREGGRRRSSRQRKLALARRFRFRAPIPKIKWYTREQQIAIACEFRYKRDEAIYQISCEAGCRIGEILSMTMDCYDPIGRRLHVIHSKTFSRWVSIEEYVCRVLNDYLAGERQRVEMMSTPSDMLFINLRSGVHLGKPLGVASFSKALKRAARAAGFDPARIITHAGRSTRAQRLKELQVTHPEIGLTDHMICEMMGWSNISSIKPYTRAFSAEVARLNRDRLERHEQEQREKARRRHETTSTHQADD